MENTSTITFNKEHELKKIKFRLWRYYNEFSSGSDLSNHTQMVAFLTTLFPPDCELIPEHLNLKYDFRETLPETVHEIMTDVEDLMLTIASCSEMRIEFLMNLVHSITLETYKESP